MKIILKESYLTNITYLQVTGRVSSCREIIAMAADVHVICSLSLNIVFIQFVEDI